MSRRKLVVSVALTAALLAPPQMWAVSCTTESEMTPSARSELAAVARSLGSAVASGNTAAVQAKTIAPVAAQFGGIAASITQASPLIVHAALTVDSLYRLEALDLTAGEQRAEFFCSVPGSSLLVTITIPDLPKGDYAVAVLHATGIADPQQIVLIMENAAPGSQGGSADWKLAGLTIRPMTLAGRDGLWFWRQARVYAGRKQPWAAHLYYGAARQLLQPADFFSSPNLLKLEKEMKESAPPELTPGPSSERPLMIPTNGTSLPLTALRAVTFSGQLDLRVDYRAQGVTGPVDTRAQMMSLMQGLLKLHPGLGAAFHGFWIYADYGDGRTFALELPVSRTE